MVAKPASINFVLDYRKGQVGKTEASLLNSKKLTGIRRPDRSLFRRGSNRQLVFSNRITSFVKHSPIRTFNPGLENGAGVGRGGGDGQTRTWFKSRQKRNNSCIIEYVNSTIGVVLIQKHYKNSYFCQYLYFLI